MNVKSLTTRGYRNLEAFTFCPGKGVNIIKGKNAQGKTNLIEAIWLFCGAKSFRGSKDIELKSDADPDTGAKLSIEFFAGEREQTAEIVIDNTKKLILNGIAEKSVTEMVGKFPAVVFSPVHLEIVKDGSALRRKFLDTAIAQIKPSYVNFVRDYTRLIQQRRALLDTGDFNSDSLAVFEEAAAAKGAVIIDFRREYVKRLSLKAEEIYRKIDQNEIFTVAYQPMLSGYLPEQGREDIVILLKERLFSNRRDDERSGKTLSGPHRDDIVMDINGRSVRAFGSQGQQRSAVLALKLSEAEILRQVARESPIILLDDVMSELDSGRQQFIYSELSGGQIFITCADSRQLTDTGNASVFTMDSGILTGPAVPIDNR